MLRCMLFHGGGLLLRLLTTQLQFNRIGTRASSNFRKILTLPLEIAIKPINECVNGYSLLAIGETYLALIPFPPKTFLRYHP